MDLTGLSDDELIRLYQQTKPQQSQQPQYSEAATKPEVNLPFGLGTIKTPDSEMGFNLPAAIIKAGGVLQSLNEGVLQAQRGPGDWLRQKLGMQPDPILQQIDQARQQRAPADQQLAAVHPGSVAIGELAPAAMAPWRALPALAAADYGSPQDRLAAGGLTYLGGKLMQQGGAAASRASARSEANAALRASQNAERGATLAAAQNEGFVVPPTTTNPTATNRILESISGKAGTQQAVSNQNAEAADVLARRLLDLSPGSPITSKAARDFRTGEYQKGYAPIESSGQMSVSTQFWPALDAITARNANASQSFPGAAAPDIKALVDSYKPPNGVFDAAHALQATQILRDEARSAFQKGDTQVGQAKLAISREIENEIERHLGPQMLKDFQASRQRMAMAHDIEDAIREGSGSIEAKVLGRKAQNQEPLSGPLRTIGNFANVFPKANQTPGVIGSPGVTKLDFGLGGLFGLGGTMAGGPIAGAAAAAAPFVIPPAVRSLLLSKPYQQFMTRPSYQPSGLLGGMSKALDNNMAPWISGLLAYNAR